MLRRNRKQFLPLSALILPLSQIQIKHSGASANDDSRGWPDGSNNHALEVQSQSVAAKPERRCKGQSVANLFKCGLNASDTFACSESKISRTAEI